MNDVFKNLIKSLKKKIARRLAIKDQKVQRAKSVDTERQDLRLEHANPERPQVHSLARHQTPRHKTRVTIETPTSNR